MKPNPARKPRIALLEFLLSQDQLFTFVVRADWPEKSINDAAPIVFKTDMDREELRGIAKYLWHMIEQFGRNKIRLDQADLSAFYQLGERIFSPGLLACLSGYQALYLVPFGDLHSIPLHALNAGGTPLIDQFEIAYLPSASVLPYLEVPARGPDILPAFLAAGVDFSNEYSHFHVEARNVFSATTKAGKSLWHPSKSALLIKEQVSRSKLIEQSSGKDVIHISTHGHFVGEDPLQSGVSLYAKSPMEVTDYLNREKKEPSRADFFLSARDIIEFMPLDAELLVVSGCLTGMSEAKVGDELLGLSRGLLYAGAKSLIVSLFPVYKQVTAGVGLPGDSVPFSEFYQLWLGSDTRKSQAFQWYIQAIKANPSFKHPFYWFSLIYIGRI